MENLKKLQDLLKQSSLEKYLACLLKVGVRDVDTFHSLFTNDIEGMCLVSGISVADGNTILKTIRPVTNINTIPTTVPSIAAQSETDNNLSNNDSLSNSIEPISDATLTAAAKKPQLQTFDFLRRLRNVTNSNPKAMRKLIRNLGDDQIRQLFKCFLIHFLPISRSQLDGNKSTNAAIDDNSDSNIIAPLINQSKLSRNRTDFIRNQLLISDIDLAIINKMDIIECQLDVSKNRKSSKLVTLSNHLLKDIFGWLPDFSDPKIKKWNKLSVVNWKFYNVCRNNPFYHKLRIDNALIGRLIRGGSILDILPICRNVTELTVKRDNIDDEEWPPKIEQFVTPIIKYCIRHSPNLKEISINPTDFRRRLPIKQLSQLRYKNTNIRLFDSDCRSLYGEETEQFLKHFETVKSDFNWQPSIILDLINGDYATLMASAVIQSSVTEADISNEDLDEEDLRSMILMVPHLQRFSNLKSLTIGFLSQFTYYTKADCRTILNGKPTQLPNVTDLRIHTRSAEMLLWFAQMTPNVQTLFIGIASENDWDSIFANHWTQLQSLKMRTYESDYICAAINGIATQFKYSRLTKLRSLAIYCEIGGIDMKLWKTLFGACPPSLETLDVVCEFFDRYYIRKTETNQSQSEEWLEWLELLPSTIKNISLKWKSDKVDLTQLDSDRVSKVLSSVCCGGNIPKTLTLLPIKISHTTLDYLRFWCKRVEFVSKHDTLTCASHYEL